jgi:hypothetical protein
LLQARKIFLMHAKLERGVFPKPAIGRDGPRPPRRRPR